MTEAGPVLAMCLALAKEPFEVKSGSYDTVVRNVSKNWPIPSTFPTETVINAYISPQVDDSTEREQVSCL
jgi:hypothetical protein